ncbi:MAG: triose-phosphate isomerase [Candidatus Saccharimonadales bacterium]
MVEKHKKLVVGNWKMHMDLQQASVFVHHLDRATESKDDTEIVLCPPFTALQPITKEIDIHKFRLGAQNLHYQDEGAFTGEVSGPMLKNLVHYVIVGHSERRKYFNETDDVVARKMSAAIRNELRPILCVGENLYERQEQHTNRVIHDQLVTGLTMLTANEVAEIVVAYEPVWAVGSGDIAKPDQIKTALATIRKTIVELFGKNTAQKVRLLYGGSVTPDLVHDYFKLKDLDGFLIGGVSLNWQQFAEIIEITQAA